MTLVADSVGVASEVLIRLADLVVREVPGVVRPGNVPQTNSVTTIPGTGIAVRMIDDSVSVDCYLVAAPETRLLELGITVQAAVTAVIEEVAKMAVREVNVYIQDVEAVRG